MAGTATTVASLKAKYDHSELVRKCLQIVVMAAPLTVDIPTAFTDDNSQLLEFPEGWYGLGIIKKGSAPAVSNDTSTSDVEGEGYPAPVRTDADGNVTTVTVTVLERLLRTNMEFQTGTDLSGVTQATTGEVQIKYPNFTKLKMCRLAWVYQDASPVGDFLGGMVLPRAQLTKLPGTNFSAADAQEMELEFKALMDTNYGSPQLEWFGGLGAKAAKDALGYKQATGS